MGIIRRTARLVVRQASSGVDVDDLVSWGTSALFGGQYDESRGVPRSAWLAQRAIGQILDKSQIPLDIPGGGVGS